MFNIQIFWVWFWMLPFVWWLKKTLNTYVNVIITSNLKVVVEPVLKGLCIFNVSQKMDSSPYNVSLINQPFEKHCVKMCWFTQSIVIFQVTIGTVQIGWTAVRTPSQTSLRCQAVRCQILQVSTAMRVMSQIHIRAIWPSHQVSAHKNLVTPFCLWMLQLMCWG